MPADVLEQLEEAPDGACAVTMDQRIILWNRAAQRILGLEPAEAIGKRCYQVFCGVSETGAPVCMPDCSVVRRARRGGLHQHCTLFSRPSSGTPKWLSLTFLLLPEVHDGQPVLVHLFYDATQEVKARQVAQLLGAALARAPRAPISRAAPGREMPPDVGALTRREAEVLHLLGQGFGTGDIADKLAVSPTTVRNHIQRILGKLRVHTRAEAVAVAFRDRP